MLSFEKIEENLNEEKIQRDIIKVKTDEWVNAKGELVIQKTIRQMRSLSESSTGYLAFENELHEAGTDAADSSLAGAQDLPDGLYQMYVKWQSVDWESGYVDEVEFGFMPVKESDCDKDS